jgi:hypothetical protein
MSARSYLGFARILSFYLTLSSFLSLTRSEELQADIDCDFYSAPTTLPMQGRGIFTAKALKAEELIERSPTLTFSNDFWSSWKLENYVFATEDKSRALVAFGMGMMYNSLPEEERNAYDAWTSDPVYCGPEITSAYSSSTDSSYYTKRDVEVGSELFISYGNHWFEARSYVQINSSTINMSALHRDLDYLKAHGVCMTHVYVSDSLIPLAGKGLFAKKRFYAGEVIYVSPVLLLPKHEVIDASNDSVLLNYCIAPLSEVDIAILPIGLSGNIYA